MITFVVRLVISVIAIHGVATHYTYAMYGGNPLYCSTFDSPLHYTSELMERYNWVAVDVGQYQSGAVRCGDTLRVIFTDGTKLDVLAWDAGPLARYYIEDWPHLPILVDFEESAWPFDNRMSAVVDVVNVSAIEREEWCKDPECHPCHHYDFFPGCTVIYKGIYK